MTFGPPVNAACAGHPQAESAANTDNAVASGTGLRLGVGRAMRFYPRVVVTAELLRPELASEGWAPGRARCSRTPRNRRSCGCKIACDSLQAPVVAWM